MTLRDNTERPETVDVRANVIAGKSIIECTKQMIEEEKGWENPYGDASELMIKGLLYM